MQGVRENTMPDGGSNPRQGEQRRGRRKPLHYPAWILTGPDQPPRKCMLSDVSDTGARIAGIGQEELPAEFLLLLSGNTRRRCRQVWRNNDRIGVEFVKPPQEAAH